MLKIVIFDSGYGGEVFADYLKENLPIVEIIRVIDWRNAEGYLKHPKSARRLAEVALQPYFGKVDLIVFANHLLTITSLKFFRRKYSKQKFAGLKLQSPDGIIRNDILVLTTQAVARTINYRNYLFRIKRKTRTLTIDSWPAKIDDGELSSHELANTIETFLEKYKYTRSTYPRELILACSHLSDIKAELKKFFGPKTKIYDSFNTALRDVCRILNIRGGTGRKAK